MKFNEWEEAVREFHTKFNATVGDPNEPRFRNAQLRKNLLTEEYQEFLHAIDYGKFDEAVHEAIDILYVTIGALISWGITDINTYFSAIHTANMNKIGGKSREDGKILKPPGWKAADISNLIRTQSNRLAKETQQLNEESSVEISTEETKKTGGKRERVARSN